MPRSSPSSRAPSASGDELGGAPVARFRMRVQVADTVVVGPGRVALLEAIGATGSIMAAAKSLGMSYRRAWLLLDEMNSGMSSPVVESARGGAHRGGSALTETGRQLVELYRNIERRAAESCAADMARLTALVKSGAASG